jgi:parallel beta-helix repeat protein
MRKTASLIIIAFTITATLSVFQPTAAQNNVLTVPDDFATINEAINNATNGDTILIRKGIYNETLLIEKAITLKGEDTNNTIINGKRAGTVIQISHDYVTLTGLTIIYLRTPNKPHIYFTHDLPANPPIAGASLGGLTNNAVFFYRAGIHLNNAQNCNIIGNRILDCGVGIWLYNAQNNNILGNLLERNDYGLQVQVSSNNLVVGNTFQKGGGGIWFWNTDYRTEDWLKPLNCTNGVYYVNNRFYQNNFIGNIKALEKQTMTKAFQNIWDDGENGNYWSDYNGADANGDGIGDSSHPIIGEYWTGTTWINGVWVEQVCGNDNYPLMTPFDISSIVATPSPAPSAIEQQPTENPVDLIAIEGIATIGGIIIVVALIVYLKKQYRQNGTQGRSSRGTCCSFCRTKSRLPTNTE